MVGHGWFADRTIRAACFAAVAVLIAGCSPEAKFRLNTVYVRAQAKATGSELGADQKRNLAEIVDAFFGTPDEPFLPALGSVDITQVIRRERLHFAAGPVGSDELGRARGLYRQHCAHCHGINGDGAGPTAAFLNPYPRDYRMGIFKFKTTPTVSPPTDDDLERILINGIPGTAMPSFKVLDDGEIEALVNYVKYLSIRGMAERKLIEIAMDELEEGQRFLDLSDTESAVFQERLNMIKEEIALVIEMWAEPESTEVPKPADDWESPESVARGRELFFSTTANCVQCHGITALGDGGQKFYDSWTEDTFGKPPTSDETIHEFLAVGALKPRLLQPRNLRLGSYRGGRRPIDLFWRIRNGIAGTPMPAATKDKLSDSDVWSLVAYVRSMPYESISRPSTLPDYQRDLP